MENIKERIEAEKIIGIIRLSMTDKLSDVVTAIIRGGINIIEITLNTPDAFTHITNLSVAFPKALVGAGTVIGKENAIRAIESGAKFIVSPIFEPEVIDITKARGAVSMAGALTPSEIYAAYSYGADYVKPFPLTGLGPAYIKALRGPFPNIPLIPTNGVTLGNITDFFKAGVTAVGLGSMLVSDADRAEDSFLLIEERAKKARHALAAGLLS
jgi:2-dehydro-3-deoxyphosphogluconate aldolase/(4S)-4-hydroxy-2-oxoglutarate aldolase